MKFEGAIGRFVGLFGGDAAKDGLVTTTVVENDRMYTSIDDRRAESIDLAEGRMDDLDLCDKTYEVTTFDELRARLQEMQERAREWAPFDASSRQPPEDVDPGREAEVDLDVQRPGEDREINGRQTEFVVTTVTVREKDRPLEESGGIVMTVRSWTTSPACRRLRTSNGDTLRPWLRSSGSTRRPSAWRRRSTIFETTSELLNIDNAPDTSVVMITANFREK